MNAFSNERGREKNKIVAGEAPLLAPLLVIFVAAEVAGAQSSPTRFLANRYSRQAPFGNQLPERRESIAVLPIRLRDRSSSGEEERTRSGGGEIAAVSLPQVRRVFIDVTGAEPHAYDAVTDYRVRESQRRRRGS